MALDAGVGISHDNATFHTKDISRDVVLAWNMPTAVLGFNKDMLSKIITIWVEV